MSGKDLIPPKQFVPFKTFTKVQMPSPQQVDDEFMNLLSDLSLSPEKQAPLLKFNTEKRWDFIEKQTKADMTVPHPKCFLQFMKTNYRVEFLTTLLTYLTSNKVSWAEGFVEEGGVTFLYSKFTDYTKILESADLSEVDNSCFQKM